MVLTLQKRTCLFLERETQSLFGESQIDADEDSQYVFEDSQPNRQIVCQSNLNDGSPFQFENSPGSHGGSIPDAVGNNGEEYENIQSAASNSVDQVDYITIDDTSQSLVPEVEKESVY